MEGNNSGTARRRRPEFQYNVVGLTRKKEKV